MMIYYNDREKQYDYINAAKFINGIDFDSLKNEGILSDGTHIKIESPINYPNDKIVYYKDIVVSVENNNGLANVVTAFDNNRNEISMP